jgi:NAD(P)-dependent dehydrogenase (short-subunit alcohol dehydrogenase family)
MAVALAAVSVEDLDEVAAELEASGGQALVVPSDVTDRDSVQLLVGRVEGSLGPVDLLVTVAEGGGPAVEFLSGDPDQWWRVVEGALRGPALCSYYVLKRMVPRRRGRIVNVLGEWSLGPAPLLSELACSEAAVLRLTDSLALASWSYGVSVFAVSAGRVTIEAAPDPDAGGVLRAPAGQEATGRLISELATGCADRLTGRFIRFSDDLQELVRRSDDVEAEDSLQLRLLQLQPSPPAAPAAVPAAPATEAKEAPPVAAQSPGEDEAAAVEPAESPTAVEPVESPLAVKLVESPPAPKPAESHESDEQAETPAEPEAPESSQVAEAAGSPPPSEAAESSQTNEPAESEVLSDSGEPVPPTKPAEASESGAGKRDATAAPPPATVEP